MLTTPAGLLQRLVDALERAIDDREPLAQFRLGDRQRRVGEEVVPAHEGVEPFLAEEPAERRHLRRRSVERRQRLAAGAAANELDDAEEADRSHCADGRVTPLEIR